METKLNAWPPGMADFVNHRLINDYIRDTSVKTGVHKRTVYNTRVEKIEKIEKKWLVRTSTFEAYCDMPRISARLGVRKGTSEA